jgi:PIN domain nuclease of toxin-antitoxin system
MRLLLDTHIFLWYITGDDHLPESYLDSIRHTENDVCLSVVSLWETTIKYQLGKIVLPESPEIYLPLQRERHAISSLSLDEASVSHLAHLPLIHRDPFDRILMCQAIEHGYTVMTIDPIFANYPVQIFQAQK